MFAITPFFKTPYRNFKFTDIKYAEQYLVSGRGISMSDIVRLKHITRESHHGGFSLLHPGKLYVFRHYEPRIWSIRTQISLHDAAFSKHIQRFSWFKFKWLSARQSVPLSKKAAKPESVKEATN